VHDEYENIAEKNLVKRHKDFVKLCGGQWVEPRVPSNTLLQDLKKSLGIRDKTKIHPKKSIEHKKIPAAKKWSALEDARLTLLFHENIPLLEIAITLGRKSSIVCARLKKLKLLKD
jgi:hypothetical protein